jgi:hypothetical protein
MGIKERIDEEKERIGRECGFPGRWRPICLSATG